jgi:hypothetical protein
MVRKSVGSLGSKSRSLTRFFAGARGLARMPRSKSRDFTAPLPASASPMRGTPSGDLSYFPSNDKTGSTWVGDES